MQTQNRGPLLAILSWKPWPPGILAKIWANSPGFSIYGSESLGTGKWANVLHCFIWLKWANDVGES